MAQAGFARVFCANGFLYHKKPILHLSFLSSCILSGGLVFGYHFCLHGLWMPLVWLRFGSNLCISLLPVCDNVLLAGALPPHPEIFLDMVCEEK